MAGGGKVGRIFEQKKPASSKWGNGLFYKKEILKLIPEMTICFSW